MNKNSRHIRDVRRIRASCPSSLDTVHSTKIDTTEDDGTGWCWRHWRRVIRFIRYSGPYYWVRDLGEDGKFLSQELVCWEKIREGLKGSSSRPGRYNFCTYWLPTYFRVRSPGKRILRVKIIVWRNVSTVDRLLTFYEVPIGFNLK